MEKYDLLKKFSLENFLHEINPIGFTREVLNKTSVYPMMERVRRAWRALNKNSL